MELLAGTKYQCAVRLPWAFYLDRVFNPTPSTDTPGYFYLAFKIYQFLINIWDTWPLNKAPSHLLTSPTVPKLPRPRRARFMSYLYISSADHRAWNIVYIKACLARTELHLNLSKALLNFLKSNLAFLKSKLFYFVTRLYDITQCI